jgi:phage terminase Nu1 subunit (DNA packaging protein)
MPENCPIKPDRGSSQAEGWRKVAVADAKAWKARAERAESEIENLERCLHATEEKAAALKAENERLRAELVQRDTFLYGVQKVSRAYEAYLEELDA